MQKRSPDRSAGPLRWLGAALTGLLPTPTTPAQINPGLSLWLDEKRGSRQLHAAGVKVALDDFGTGYASLTHLLNVPIDIIKIDQRFIARLRPDDASTIIVEGLFEIARRLDIGVIAEGIETEAQTCQLWSMGCNLGQGFAFARAADRDATARLLHQHSKRIAGTMPLNAGRAVTHPDADRSEPAKRRAAVR